MRSTEENGTSTRLRGSSWGTKFRALVASTSAVLLCCVSLAARDGDNTSDVERSPVERGKALIDALGCVICHDIEGHETTVREEAPNLTYEGGIVRRDWLSNFLAKPYRIRPAISARMPDFRLTERENVAITEYLATLEAPGDPPSPELLQLSTDPEQVETGALLMSNDYFECFKCHIKGEQLPEGEPEEWGPDLTRVRNRIKPDFFFKWLVDASVYRPGTKMPAFFVDEYSGPDDVLEGDEMKHMAAIRDYLMSVGVEEKLPDYKALRKKYRRVSPYEGRALVSRLNCVGCHEFAMLPNGKKVGPNLSTQGSRVRKEWLLDFLRAPYTIKPEYELMGSHARMPTFHFEESELTAIVEYLSQVLVDKDLEEDVELDPSLAGRGSKLFSEKKCDNCHRIGKRPGGIGPELTDAGKRLRPNWTITFIQTPRHYLETRMPNLKVSEEEALALAAYILGAK